MNQPNPKQRWSESFTDPSGAAFKAIVSPGITLEGSIYDRDILRTPQRAGQRPQRHRLRPDLPEGASAMPMIDVYAIAGTFPDKHQLAADPAAAVMTIQPVPEHPIFPPNTTALIHNLPPRSLSN